MQSYLSPATKCDTEAAEDLDRDPGRGVLARVGDSFDVADRDGKHVRLTLLRVVDPAPVEFFGDSRAESFPRDWRDDWYDDRRYCGLRLRVRYLDPDPELRAGALIG